MNARGGDGGRTVRCLLAAGGVALALGTAGCASFSDDGGFGPVAQATQRHVGQEVRWQRQDSDRDAAERRVAQLLAGPLAMDDAVQLALLNNRGLQAAFQELGIAEADLVQAGRLANPGFSFTRLTRGEEVELERGLHFNLGRLLAMPLLQQVEQRRFEQAQVRATEKVLALAADTRRAWVQAVAADEVLRYRLQVVDAAEAGAELARRMRQAGNFNRLQQTREQAFQAEAALDLARARQLQTAARERLIRLLGLWGEPAAALRLPERLPELPAAARELPDVERLALAQRLDVQGAKLAAEQTARNLGLTRVTGFVDVLELGLVRNSSNEAPTQRGWEVSLELPIFDFGAVRTARAQALYRQALEQAAQTAVEARSQVREAYQQYRLAWDIARHHRDELLPLRARIAEENLLRYNGMLIGVFELLADARAQSSGVAAAIEAQRDFWLAQADLDMALIGRAGSNVASAAAGASTAGPAGSNAAASGDGH